MGALAILLIFAVFCIAAIARPWVGATGYFFFAVLCPQWNWRWSLPDYDFQKFLAAATLVGFALSGLRYAKLQRSGRWSLVFLVATLLLNFISSSQSIAPETSGFFLDIFWKITLMASIASGLYPSHGAVRAAAILLVIAQGWNAFNINQLYFSQSFINLNSFRWNYLDNNTYSISTVPIFALTIALLLTDRDRRIRYLMGLIAVLQLHQIMILESRGTMLGVLLLLGLAIWVMPRNRWNWSVVGGGIALSVVLAGPPVVKEFVSIFADDGQRDSSADSRFELWSAGWRITADYPVLGVGPWAGQVLVPEYYEGEMAVAMERKALHNLFFEMSTGAGVLALIVYLAFFGLPFWIAWKEFRSTRRSRQPIGTLPMAMVCGVPAFWLSSMFSSGILIESPYVLVVLGIAEAALPRVAAGSVLVNPPVPLNSPPVLPVESLAVA